MIALQATRSPAHVFIQNLKLARRFKSMFAWKVTDSLDNSSEVDIATKLKYVETKLPTISSPSDVLVKVHSTSINPLDLRMMYGYGRKILDIMDIMTNFEPRITNDRYPLTLGRDFSGEVVATGPLANEYRVGDLVFGSVEPHRPGSHAQYVTVPSYCITKKPGNLSHDEAASIPFVALTAYAALRTFGNINPDKCDGKQVLVIGGSGGVGSFAVQLLKFWGATVVATASKEKTGWLENELLVDQTVCHDDISQLDTLNGRFDFVLDCGNYNRTTQTRENILENSLRYLKPYSQSVYVTISPPILSNVEHNGLVVGGLKTLHGIASDTFKSLANLNSARWAIYLPNKKALDYVSSLLEEESMAPIVDTVFGLNEMPNAFEALQSGDVRGKVVVNVMNKRSSNSTKIDNSMSANSAVSSEYSN